MQQRYKSFLSYNYKYHLLVPNFQLRNFITFISKRAHIFLLLQISIWRLRSISLKFIQISSLDPLMDIITAYRLSILLTYRWYIGSIYPNICRSTFIGYPLASVSRGRVSLSIDGSMGHRLDLITPALSTRSMFSLHQRDIHAFREFRMVESIIQLSCLIIHALWRGLLAFFRSSINFNAVSPHFKKRLSQITRNLPRYFVNKLTVNFNPIIDSNLNNYSHSAFPRELSTRSG